MRPGPSRLGRPFSNYLYLPFKNTPKNVKLFSVCAHLLSKSEKAAPSLAK